MAGSLGIIFNNDRTEILLVKRRDVPIWVIPGGGIEPDETPEQACVREVFEETGFKSEIIKKVGVYTYKSTHQNHAFECKIIGGKKTLSKESKAVDFWKIDKLPEIRSPHTHIFLEDALIQRDVVERDMTGYPFSIWRKGLRHPWVLFKFLLVRMGIHWNI